MNNKYPKVIVEAKTGLKNLEDEEFSYKEQLYDYFFELSSAKLGILTNGYEWWFFLPRNRDNWRMKKFCNLKFKKDSIKDIYDRLMDFLYFEKLNNGLATRKSINSVDKYCIDDSLMGPCDELFSVRPFSSLKNHLEINYSKYKKRK